MSKKHFFFTSNPPNGPTVGLSLLTSTLSARATGQVIFSYSKQQELQEMPFDCTLKKSIFSFSSSICY